VNDLQSLVDALAAELGRPVGIDDARFRSLAYSSHVDELDQVRLSSILQREAPKAVTEYLTNLGIDRVEHHCRIPANPALGMVARVCLPLRFGETLLGYVWLFDEPSPLRDVELALARRFADEAAALIFRLRQLESADRSVEREMLTEVLGLRRGDPETAGERLAASGRLAPTARRHVVVLEARSAAGAAVDDQVRVRLSAAADRLRRSAAPGHVLAVSAGDAAITIVAVDEDSGLERKLDQLLDFARHTLADASHWSPIVGVSGPYTSLARSRRAFDEARRALTVAAVEPAFAPIARWDALGAFRTVLQLLGDGDPADAVPASLNALLDAPDADTLVPTLAAWLDNGGDAKRTAEELFVHRSSLYNRLNRIQAVSGVNLRSGDARLELHLGLRLWRLAGGRTAPAGPSGPTGDA